MSEQKLSTIFSSFPRVTEQLQYQIQLDELYPNRTVNGYKNNRWFMPPNSDSTPWGSPFDEFNRNLITFDGISKQDVLIKISQASDENLSESELMKKLGRNADEKVKKHYKSKLIKNFFRQHQNLRKIFEQYCCQRFTYFFNNYITEFLDSKSHLIASHSDDIKANFRISRGELFADVSYPTLNFKDTSDGQCFRLASKTLISFKFVAEGIQLIKVSTDSGIIDYILKGEEYPLSKHFAFLNFASVDEKSKNVASDFYYQLYVLLNKFINTTADPKIKSSFQIIYNNVFNKENTTAEAWIDCANQIIILASYRLNELVNAEYELNLLALLDLGFKLQNMISSSQKHEASQIILEKIQTSYLVSEFWNIANALGLSFPKENEASSFARKVVLLAKRKAIDESVREYPFLLQLIGEKLSAKTQSTTTENKKVKSSQYGLYQQYLEELINQYKTVYAPKEHSVGNDNSKVIKSLKSFSNFLGKNSNIKISNNELRIMYLYGSKLKQTDLDSANFLQEYSKNQSGRIYQRFSFEDLLLLAPCQEIVLPAINVSKYSKSIIKLVKDRNKNQKNSPPVNKAFENLLSNQEQITPDKHLGTYFREVILENKDVANNLATSDIVALVKDDNLSTRKVLKTGFFSTLFKTDILNRLSSEDLKKLLIAQPDVASLVFEPRKTFFGLITYLNIANKLTDQDLFSVVINNKQVDIKLLKESKQLDRLSAYIESDASRIEQLGKERFDLLFAIFEQSKFYKKKQAFSEYQQLFDLFSEDNLDTSIQLTDFTKNWLKHSATTSHLNEDIKAKLEKILKIYNLDSISINSNESSDSDTDDVQEPQIDKVFDISRPDKVPPVTPEKPKNKSAKDKSKEEDSSRENVLNAEKNEEHVSTSQTNRTSIVGVRLKP